MGKGLVLIFHKEENSRLFEKIVLSLKNNYLIVSANQLEQLLIKGASTSNVCHITFDDGIQSFYTVVFPVLKKHNIPASLFVSPRIISTGNNFWFQEIESYDDEVLKDILAEELYVSLEKLEGFSSQTIFKCLPISKIKKIIELYKQRANCGAKLPQNMTIEQLREIDASGLVAIGAHTINHPILRNEDDESCFKEIHQSITDLAYLLGHPVSYFAYPNGRPELDFGEREMKYLKENNITMAFSTELDTLNKKNNLLSITRMGFASMGLEPSNPIVKFRLNLGKRWIDIKSIGRPTEKEVREKIKTLLAS